MTSDQFTSWFRYHTSRFTEVVGWLSKFPASPRYEGDVTQRCVRDAWEEVLAGVDLDNAMRATDELFRGSEQFSRTTGFDHHPRDVRRVAAAFVIPAAPEVKIVDGQRAYRCKVCLDDGRVLVWHPRSMQAAREGVLGERCMEYSCAVCCTCEAGQIVAEAERRYYLHRFKKEDHQPIVFDGAKMVKCQYHPGQDDRDALIGFVESAGVGKEFDPDEF